MITNFYSDCVGMTETLLEKRRSILAQLEYSYQIREWTSKGVPFLTYFYVPETLPETDSTFLEREDEAHVFSSGIEWRTILGNINHVTPPPPPPPPPPIIFLFIGGRTRFINCLVAM